MVAADPATYLIDRCPNLERISIMMNYGIDVRRNYLIDVREKQGHLLVRYANFKETGPTVSVWMVPL